MLWFFFGGIIIGSSIELLFSKSISHNLSIISLFFVSPPEINNLLFPLQYAEEELYKFKPKLFIIFSSYDWIFNILSFFVNKNISKGLSNGFPIISGIISFSCISKGFFFISEVNWIVGIWGTIKVFILSVIFSDLFLQFQSIK